MRRSLTVLVALSAIAAVSTLAACDKLKSAVGKDDGEGGAPSSGGGVLSFLGSEFEGEITMALTVKSGAPPREMVMGIKKPKYRVDAKGFGSPTMGGAKPSALADDKATLILEPANKRGYVLVPAKKQAMLLDFDKMKTMQNIPGMNGNVPGVPKTVNAPPKVEKTGVKDKVAGYGCEIWKITQTDGRRADACVADGITWVDLSDLGWASPEITMAAVASEANRFPLRVVSIDPKGVEESRLEATKIDKKNLADAQFTVPADYQVIDLGQMMQGLQNLGVGPNGLPTNLPKPPARK